MNAHLRFAVSDRSETAFVRHQARLAAEHAGFDETDAHRVGLVATELASNLVKHAGGSGEVLLRAEAGDLPEIELLAVDRGPGIADIVQSLSDGYSTAGSPGTGLGAVRRLADEFDIFSQPGKGTIVLARLRRTRDHWPAPARVRVGGVSVPHPNETVCGDRWTIASDRSRTSVFVVDGLGHGEHAASAATGAVAVAETRPFATGIDAMQAMHAAIRHTRGAAATVAALDLQTQVVTVVGVGNVAAAIVGREAVRQAVSLGGILGHEVRQFRDYQYPWTPGALLIVHSDGLISHWSIEGYPGLRQRDPAVAAAVLYRDYQRGRDDVTVVVAREAA